MGFQIAELFVDITLRSASFNKGLAGIKSGIEKMAPAFRGLQLMATAGLASMTAAAGFAVKEFMNAETASAELNAALIGTNQAADGAAESLKALANEIQGATTLENDQIVQMLANSLKLGASVKNLPTIAKLGVGLGEMYFGGDAAEGIRKMTLAQQGNLRELKWLIPELRSMSSRYAQLQLIQHKATEGLALAEARTHTLAGQLSILKVAVINIGQSFGALMAPYVHMAAESAQHLLGVIQKLTPAQKTWALEVAGCVAAGLALLAVLPSIVKAMYNIGKAVIGAVQTIWSFGEAIIGAATSPIGMLLIAIGAAVSALAIFEGSGDTAFERLVSGFGVLGDMANTFLGSWQGMCIAWETVTLSTGENIRIAWAMLKDAWGQWCNIMETMTEAFASGFKDVMGMLWDGIQIAALTAIHLLKVGWMSFFNWMFEKLQKVNDAYEVMMGYKTQSDADNEEKMSGDDNAANSKAEQDGYNKKNGSLLNDLDKLSKHWVKDQKALLDAGISHSAELDKKMTDEIDGIKNQTADELAKLTNQLSSLPTLSDKVKELLEQLKHSTGADDFAKKMKELMDAYKDDIKSGKLSVDKKDWLDPQGMTNQPKLHFTSLQEAFKSKVALSMFGQDMQKNDEKQRQLDAQRVREQSVEELKKIRKHLEQDDNTYHTAPFGVLS